MSNLSLIFIIYFYLSIIIFIVGTIFVLIKWIFTPKGRTGTYLGFPYLFTYPGQNTRLDALKNILKRIFFFSSLRYDKGTRVASMVFHYSLWIIILAHFDLFLEPYFVSHGISFSTIALISDLLGNGFAILLISSGLYLLYRRIENVYLRYISTPGDYFSIILILLFGFTGLLMRFILPVTYAYNSVGPFISSLFSLSPIEIPTAPIFLIHFTLACTLVLYVPFSKFMHPFSFFTNPTLYSIYHER